MRLTDLDPHWIGVEQGEIHAGVHYGITFLCPHCRTTRIGVMFDKPLDPLGWEKQMKARYGENNFILEPLRITNDGKLWARTGDSFDTLSLQPSINCAASGHWHGFVTAGEVTP